MVAVQWSFSNQILWNNMIGCNNQGIKLLSYNAHYTIIWQKICTTQNLRSIVHGLPLLSAVMLYAVVAGVFEWKQ